MATKIRPFNLHTDTETRIQTLAGNLIDSAYVNARVSTVDSAAVQVIVDSDYVKTTLKVGSTNTIFRYVATANQTSFTGSDANSATLAYNPGAVQVFLNGSLLTPTVDFTTDSGDTITLVSGAALGSELVINTYKDGIITPTNALPIIGGELTGNLTMGDNKKIKLGNDSDAEIFHNASNTIINDKGTGNILLQVAGTTHFKTDANGVQIPDNKKLLLGASSDLQIYHDGSNSFVDDAGSGSLYLRGESQVIIGNMSGEQAAVFNDDGAVTLNYDNSQKLATTSAGVSVTGNVSVSGDIIKTTAGTSNFAAGVNAGNSITSGGNYNVVVGDEAGTALTTGDKNVAIGFEALSTEDGHGFNVAVGHQALKTLNAGQEAYHTAVGYLAGTSMTTAFANTVIGGVAGDALTDGNNNTAVGVLALSADTRGSKSVAVGYGALEYQNFTSVTDVYNTAVGFSAGNDITTGTYNTIIGGLAGDALTTGEQNVAIGAVALSTETEGDHSVAVGYGALSTQNGNSGSVYNVAVGHFAGASITTGIRNVLIGGLAGDALSIGNYNVGIGLSALTAETKGTGSVAIGYKALQLQNFTSATTTHNTAVGYLSGFSTTSGTSNTYIGSESGYSTNTGIRNVAVGHQAMYSNTDGSNNTALGWQALYTSTGQGNNVAIGWQSMLGATASESVAVGRETLENATGDDNVAVGYQAGLDMTSGYKNTLIGRDAGGDITTGAHNICVGTHSGNYAGQTTIQSGGQNILIGNYARPSATNQAYETIIGYNVGGQGSQTFTFGQGSTDTSIAFGGTSWSAPSDERLKEDIKDETVGLDFINELRPVTFQWKKANDIPESMEDYDKNSNDRIMNGKYNHGFIAQEVKAVIDKYEIKDGCNLWQESSGDKRQRLAEGELIPFLVKAVQELSAEVTTLTNRITELENK